MLHGPRSAARRVSPAPAGRPHEATGLPSHSGAPRPLPCPYSALALAPALTRLMTWRSITRLNRATLFTLRR